MKKSKSNKQEDKSVCLYEVPDKETANRQFIKAVKSNDTGGNNHVDTFLKVLERVFATSSSGGTFSVYDVIRESRGTELSAEEVKTFFERWCQINLRLNKICETFGCYSYPVYTRIG